MGADFTIKPIGKTPDSGFPDAIPSNISIAVPKKKNTSEKSNKKSISEGISATSDINTNSDITPVSGPTPLIRNMTPSLSPQIQLKSSVPGVNTSNENQEIINIDVDFIVKQIQDVLKSPSPITLYKKSAELKENFASFINYLVKKIALGFTSQNKTIILSMYQNAGYEYIWFNNLKPYLDEAKYFDVRIYLKAITTFNKEKQYIAKTLLKLYIGTKEEEILKYLKKFGATTNLNQIKSYYKILGVDKVQITDQKYLDENMIELFLEKLYFTSDDLGMFFQFFCFNVDEMKGKFKDIYSIFSDIARSYLKKISPKTKLIYEYLYSKDNKDIIKQIDGHIDNYLQDKKGFYKNISVLLVGKNTIERGYFWSYVKTNIIDKYFSEVSRLFYWDKNACSNRNEWASLKGNFSYNPKTQYANEINEILQFKKLILELNTNIFSSFLKPLVYSIVSEKLSINRKDLLKIRYLMTLVLSENYQEYKKIYNFFEDLEAFMDYNMESFGFNFAKIKIFASDIILGLIGLGWLYIYSPVGVFVSSLILSISYIRSHFFRFKAGIEWNIGVRPIATAMLAISAFYWITNLDTTKIDIAKLSSKIEKIGVYKTDVAAKVALQKINDSGIKQAVADILQFNKKTK